MDVFNHIACVVWITIAICLGIPFAEGISLVCEGIGGTQGNIGAFDVRVNEGGYTSNIGIIGYGMSGGNDSAVREGHRNHLNTGLASGRIREGNRSLATRPVLQ